jgi:anthranilate synthase/aminodeoxychorismate synthase-like glutamine amidotransferase
MLLLIDNYDSFVHNLARYVEELGVETHVVRNDALSVTAVQQLAPEAIILSPGPCSPAEAGICMEIVQQLGASVPLLGVCLGHQAIAAALGGQVIRSPVPQHGRASRIRHNGSRLFQGCPSEFQVGRYHSLLVDEATLPAELTVTARTVTDNLIMALEHRNWPVWGVQFHPESVLTEQGHRLLANFLKLSGMTSPEQFPRGDLADTTGVEPASAIDFFRQPIITGNTGPGIAPAS